MDTAVQTFEPTPEPSPRPSANAPQLRTLLLTDLVDSTGLVERLGDAPASDLFRAHDHLVLKLQQQWRGRLIDRSDGMLLLFERPIDGLGFALDYTRGLIALGDERGIELRARIGLHVGEVLTWRNSDEAVSVGAKPVEVEGLAKPMAARLMATARPGQILLSAVAEPLAHRAARELGERGQHLAWKTWGRWRFKGVPESQYIFEVGEPGIAPLRMPPDTPKAWRDIPLWRRPAALAAEAALLAGLALGAWFIARPEPAIAFNQRDWVVIGDLRNLTGQATLDDSLEQAFRISLEQSRHVNVLSDLKARDTLARMQRTPDTKLDRAIASEIALRDGARAVILPTVAEVGGRVRVSAEVIDPRTQTTVYTETAEGTGVASTLDSIDTVTASLRGKLGEAVKTIEKDSVPLPQVTTKNLDALRAYALGQKEYANGNSAEALTFYQRATTLDPGFALAWIGQVRSYYSNGQAPKAVSALHRARELRARFATREAMYVDAWASDYETPADTRKKWVELALLYPDFVPAQANAAIWLMLENRHNEALPYLKRQLVRQNPMVVLAYDDMGKAQLGLEKYEDAAKAFAAAIDLKRPVTQRRMAQVRAAQRQFEKAERLLTTTAARGDRYFDFERIAIAVDRGRWKEASAISSLAVERIDAAGTFESKALRLSGAVVGWLSDSSSGAMAEAQQVVRSSMERVAATRDADSVEDALLAAHGALLAQRMGNGKLLLQVIKGLESRPELRAHPVVAELDTVMRAENARNAGNANAAIEILRPALSGHERYQSRMAMLLAASDAGKLDLALEQARWLQRRRGLAYGELGCDQCMQALNVADSNQAILYEAELLAKAGNLEEAQKTLARFDALWPPKDLARFLRQRRDALLASLRLDDRV